jgi:ParB-like chromosome segregation protein Spo0J
VYEIGKAEEIDLGEVKLTIHTRADPYEEAQAIKVLLAAGWTQMQVSKVLDLSQSNISKRLRLLNLEGTNIERLKAGKLKITPAYYLVRGKK